MLGGRVLSEEGWHCICFCKKYIKVARKMSCLSQKVYDAVRAAILKSDWWPYVTKIYFNEWVWRIGAQDYGSARFGSY